MDGLQHAGDFGDFVVRRVREHIAIKVHDAALPSSVGIELSCRFDQATASIRNDQLHALEAALFEMTKKSAPALQIFLLTFSDAQDLPETIGADADRHQHADVAHFAGPATLE